MGESKAVFLSYASEDSEAAQRIADALKAAGVEVWFDKAELRGGDAWDRHIREHIHDCRLFIPIISANTEARDEGYFRREWRLAVERAGDMHERRTFLVPVVIDGTRERGAAVPDRFRELQWTRLPDGETPATFVARITGLLESNREQTTSPAFTSTGIPSAPRRVRSHLSVVVVVVFLAVAVAGGMLLWHHSRLHAPDAVASASEGSIAVLPFVDMSERHDQEYFSDGLAEELLDLLSKTPNLKVIARTSSFSFKGKSDDIPTIGAKLNVAHILEGSVRKAGSRIRVTTQLVRTDTGVHIWSETYDRELSDLFELQDEIAGAVVHALRMRLGIDPITLQQARTENLDAHDAYLQAQQMLRHASRDGYRLAMTGFGRAIALDPNFAPGYVGLAEAEALFADTVTGDMAGYKRAQEAAEKAVTLAPDLASARALRGWIRFKFFWDWRGANADIASAIRLSPGDSDVLRCSAELLDALGRSTEAAATLRRALDADPLSGLAWADLGRSLTHAGDLTGARHALDRALGLNPDIIWAQVYLGYVLLLEGDAREAIKIAERPHLDRDTSLIIEAFAAHALGDRARSDRALAAVIAVGSRVYAYEIAQIYAWRADRDHAFEWLFRAHAQQDGGLIRLRSDPLFARLRDDPRFADLLREMHFPE